MTRLPLRLVLIVPFVLELGAAAALISWLSIRNGQKAVQEVTTELRSELTDSILKYLDGYLETPHLINELNADALKLGSLDERDAIGLGRHFWHQLQRFDGAAFVFFGSPDGGSAGAGWLEDGTLVVDATDLDPDRGLVNGTRYEFETDGRGERGELRKSTPGFDARERPWYRAALETAGPVWTDVFPFFRDEATLAIAGSLPVYGDGGELRGVFGVDLTLAGVGEFLRSLKIGQTGEAFIIERSGRLLASSTTEKPFVLSSSGDEVQRQAATDSAHPLLRASTLFLIEQFGELNGIHQDEQFSFELDGLRQFGQVTPLRDGRGVDWLVVTVLPAADFMAQIDANTRVTIWLSVVAFAVAVVLGLATARWVAGPILRLSHASTAIADGQLDLQVRDHGINELAELGGSFNRMAAQLKSSFGELEARVDERTAQLKEALGAADAANRAKSDFLANISHDIRTPLAAILGYVELLSDRRGSPEETERFLQTIRNNGSLLNQLLSDLLDISRIEAGRLDLNPQPTELARLLAQISSDFAPRAKERGLHFEIRTDVRLPWTFTTDPVRLRQILANLLANAIKFTKRGDVTVSVESERHPDARSTEDPDRATLVFGVKDTGVGISGRDQKKLFQRFTQVDTSDAREAKGFSLGLSIVRQLSDIMGGAVDVQSELGRGSTFRVRIPVTDCLGWDRRVMGHERPVAIAGLADQAALSGRILIAEDSTALRELCKQILERWGLQCDVVRNGREALEIASQETFDVILMDWQMPEMDGLQATTRLRRMGRRTPIVALTAAAMAGDREKCLEAGCDSYLVKPIDFKELHRLLRGFLGGEDEVATRLAGGRGGPDPDAELLALSRKYVLGLPERVADLRGVLEAADWKAFNAGVHKLVGTAGSYGLAEIVVAAEGLEAAGRAQDPERAARWLDRLASAVTRAVDSAPL